MVKGTITAADFFAEIGGIRIAFEKAGVETVWANDNDNFCAEVYRENFGRGEFILGDIREIPSSEIPEFDILCAGFPCPVLFVGRSIEAKEPQPTSRTGGQDEGTLFREMVRVLKGEEARGVFENPAGSKFCNRCGMVLDDETALIVDEKRRRPT